MTPSTPQDSQTLTADERLRKSALAFVDWIIWHKSGILNGMTSREVSDFTEELGKFRAALNQGQGRNEPVGVTTQWRHKKRGTVYTEIGRGKAQASTEFIADDDDVVIYRGEDGLIWVRQVKEFEDGRFDRLSAAIGERG